eukprot:403334042
MESPQIGSGQTMPQSHQELFGYYMNNVLEREDDDDEVFVASDQNSRRDNNSPTSNNVLNLKGMDDINHSNKLRQQSANAGYQQPQSRQVSDNLTQGNYQNQAQEQRSFLDGNGSSKASIQPQALNKTSYESRDPLLPFDPSKTSMGHYNNGFDNNSLVDQNGNGEYVLYRYRFFNLALYCFAAAINQIAWISLQPVADAVSNAYDQDTTTVNTISLVYMGVYLIVNFPSNYALDAWGCRWGIVIGTMLTFVGMWIKVLVNQGFWILIVGQMISALGQPFLTNAPAKMAAQWYGEKGRIIATTIATASIPLGVAVGFVIPSFFVDDGDRAHDKKDDARSHIFNSLLCQAIIGTVVAILILFFFKDKPPTPPSSSAGAKKDAFGPSINQLFRNKVVWLLVIIFGFVQGVFNTLGTVVGEIATQFDYSTDDASVFGAVFIVGGIIGSAVFGIWVEIKKTYKLSVIIICALSVASTVGVSASFYTGESWMPTLFCFIVGFCMIPIMAVGFELGVEVTYPIDESYSTGFLMFSGQLLGIVFTVISSQLINDYGKNGCLISEGMYVGSLLISFVLSFFIKEDLKRQRVEKQKRERADQLRDRATMKTHEIKSGSHLEINQEQN